LDTLERLRDFVTSRFAQGKAPSIHPEDDLLRLGILDSIAIMQIIDQIEQDFGIELEGDEITMDNFQSLASMSRMIERRRGDSASA